MSGREYFPDFWVVVKITDPEGKFYYKILGSWGGGYLYGASWKLSSGVMAFDRKEDGSIVSPQHSGSVYVLRERGEGMSAFAEGVYESMVEEATKAGWKFEQVDFSSIELPLKETA